MALVGGVRQLVGELFVKAPKRCFVVVPAVVDHIGVQWGHAVIAKPLLDLIKRALNIVRVNVQHVVVPAVVLHAEVAFGADVFNVVKERALHLCHGVAGGAAHDSSRAGKAAVYRVTYIVFDLTDAVLNTVVRGRKLTAEEQAVNVKGLTQDRHSVRDLHAGLHVVRNREVRL